MLDAVRPSGAIEPARGTLWVWLEQVVEHVSMTRSTRGLPLAFTRLATASAVMLRESLLNMANSNVYEYATMRNGN